MVIPNGPHTVLKGLVSRIINGSSIHRGEGLRLNPRIGLLDWAGTPPVLGRGMAGTTVGWLEITEIRVGLHSTGIGTLLTQ